MLPVMPMMPCPLWCHVPCDTMPRPLRCHAPCGATPPVMPCPLCPVMSCLNAVKAVARKKYLGGQTCALFSTALVTIMTNGTVQECLTHAVSYFADVAPIMMITQNHCQKQISRIEHNRCKGMCTWVKFGAKMFIWP